ncbi:hypothetical protein IV203_000067 (plastid) [Nitzschia inconspicua]|uniref:Uncharacterized protein n=1 Tax=Nitzschia inconspicua TaxID=303405 RepID=A0A8H2SI85_9STRA|nr:hypothetical protein IV203_000067 [Nitzschia inconspicua]
MKKKVKTHLKHVAYAFLSLLVVIGPSPARALDSNDVINQTLANESSSDMIKEALNLALQAAKSKPLLAVATSITCLACVPASGVAAIPGLCIACGILIAKTFG